MAFHFFVNPKYLRITFRNEKIICVLLKHLAKAIILGVIYFYIESICYCIITVIPTVIIACNL